MLLCPVPFVLNVLQMVLGNYSIALVTLKTESLMMVALFLPHCVGKNHLESSAMKEWGNTVSFKPVFSTAHQ